MSTYGYARPPVLDRVGLDRHAVIEASAGTGKTFTLEHLVVELVIRRALDVEQLVVVTYTDKATRELRARVRQTLERVLYPAPDDPNVRAVPDDTCWRLDADVRARLAEQLHRFDAAPISTIHAFCQRILSEHAFEHGRLFQQEQVDARGIFARAFREELRVALADGHVLQPVLAALLKELHADTLVQRAWELHARSGELLPRADVAGVVAALRRLPTSDGWAGVEAELLRATGRADGGKLSRVVRMLVRGVEEALDGQGGESAALGHLMSLPARDRYGVSDVPAICDALHARVPAHQALLADVSMLLRASHPNVLLAHGLLPAVRERLRAMKDAGGALDFDDMLARVRDGLMGQRGPSLVQQLRRRFRVALVDEFQDTDQVQWDIFRTLFVEGTTEHRLYVIGDPKQAIFAFRNADVHTYRAARDHLLQHGGRQVDLVENQRSTPALVAAYNRVLAEDYFTGINQYPHPVVAARASWQLVNPEGAQLPPLHAVHLWARTKAGLEADALRRAMARFTARECRRILSPERPLRLVDTESGADMPIRARDIHVLVGTGAEGQGIADALRAAGVPVAFFKQEGLWQGPEASALRDVLAALAEPGDVSRRLRAWLTPYFGIPVHDLERARVLEDPSHPLNATLEGWTALARARRWAPLFASMLEDSGLARRELLLREGRRQLTNHEHVLETMLHEASRGHGDIHAVLQRLDDFIHERAMPAGENPNTQRMETEADAVQVLTVHKAKGLEATVVFLAGAFARRWDDFGMFHDENGVRCTWVPQGAPRHIRDRVDAETREELERLGYVAMTRARARMYLPYLGLPRDADAPQAVTRRHHVRKPGNGVFWTINARVDALVAEGAHRGADALLAVEPEPVDAADVPLLQAAQPPPVAVDEPEVEKPAPDATHFDDLRHRHRGFTVTHYTRLKKQLQGAYAPGGGDDVDEILAEFLEPAPGAHVRREGVLPGGASMGVFLHALLEHADFRELREHDDARTWMALPHVAEGAAEHAARNGIDAEHVEPALELVHRVLCAPVQLAELGLPRGFRALDDVAAEMKLLFPIPDSTDMRAWDFRVQRGFIRGVIDLVFRRDGRTWFVDWKSDILLDASPAALRAHVGSEYRMQAILYTLGVCRVLGIGDRAAYENQFGGLVYAFIRDMRMDDPGAGLHVERPTWEDVVAWELALRSGHAPWPELWKAA